MCVLRRARADRPRSLARAGLLAVAFAVLPLLDRERAEHRGLAGDRLAVALLGIAALGVAVLALARELGALRAGDRPARRARDPRGGAGARRPHGARWTSSPGRARARGLHVRGLRAVPRARAGDRGARPRPARALRTFDEVRDAHAWAAAGIPGSPFAVALDEDGTVLAKGTFNTPAQLESVLATAERRRGNERVAARFPLAGSGTLMAVTGAEDGGLADRARRGRGLPLLRPHLHDRLVPAPDRAAADRLQGPPAAREGRPPRRRPRPPDRPRRRPVDEDGTRLTDADGVPLPAASRTPVCKAVAERYGIDTKVDGAWYRCCGGHVRKLVDCCSPPRSASTATPR